MERDVLSMRQLMVLLVTALLAPATDLLPTLTAQMAGRAGWLSVLGALPLLLLAFWAARGIFCDRGICRALGKVPGGIIIIIYLTWTLLLLALFLRLSATRLAEIYGEGPAFAYAAVLLVVAAWMGRGKVSAFARAGEIFYLVLAVALAGVLLLATANVEESNFRVSASEAVALPMCSVTTAGLLLNVYPAAVLKNKVAVRAHNGRRVIGWIVAFCITITLLLGAVIGCVGPHLTAQLPAPFLIMVQGLGIKGAFQRTEALFIALWTLSDLTLFGLLLHTSRELAGELHKGKWCRWSVLPVTVVALIGGWLFVPKGEETRIFCSALLPMAGLIFGLGCPLVSRIILQLCKRGK